MTDDLVTWLRAQLDEDERIALAAKSHTGRWRWDHGFGDMCNDAECPYGMLLDEATEAEAMEGTVVMHVHGYDITEPWQGAPHIARHDPARVLAEVAATRRLIDRYERAVKAVSLVSHFQQGQDDGYQQACLDAIRDRAEVYADQPDYREEWRLA